MTVRNCQNRRNEVSLIVGNLAAAIAAKKQREATPHTPLYARTWRRQFVVEVYRNLGSSYFRRAYNMTYESFCHLHHKRSPGIKAAARVLRKYQLRGLQSSISKPPPVPNGPIPSSIRLACALRYFAGGSPYDLMSVYGVSHTIILDSVWCVVEAINQLRSPRGKEDRAGLYQKILTLYTELHNCDY